LKKRFGIILILILFLVSTTGCMKASGGSDITRVGMLIEHSINDQTWGNKGYRGLLAIQEEHNVEVFFQEGVNTQQQVNYAVEQFVNNGVQLIIGHSSIYGEYFHKLQAAYPDIEFLYVNGAYSDENLTSLNFNSLSMGFFAGMIAGKMSETGKVGIIAAYEWQPEVEGFYEGVAFENPNVDVEIKYVYSWDKSPLALEYYNEMVEQGVDVIYPAGDAYSIQLIEAAKADDIYSIGYVNDQQSIGGDSVLTSTIQHVDKLYLYAVEQIMNEELAGGIYNYGFQQEVISMGPYSERIPKQYQDKIDTYIKTYIETGLLPHQIQ
jgi:transcriptional activator of comK gene